MLSRSQARAHRVRFQLGEQRLCGKDQGRAVRPEPCRHARQRRIIEIFGTPVSDGLMQLHLHMGCAYGTRCRCEQMTVQAGPILKCPTYTMVLAGMSNSHAALGTDLLRGGQQLSGSCRHGLPLRGGVREHGDAPRPANVPVITVCRRGRQELHGRSAGQLLRHGWQSRLSFWPGNSKWQHHNHRRPRKHSVT